MKKLLFQFDTDPQPSSFDSVVAYDGGADRVIAYGGLTADTIGTLVEGAIFTRAPKAKKNTAILVGGSDIDAGQALFQAVQKHFFAGFQVSIMLDSNGCNTTSAAAIAKIATSTPLAGKKVVILAGTGPVGQRAAALFAMAGARVAITSRRLASAEAACSAIKNRFAVALTPLEASHSDARGDSIKEANIVLAAGAAGVELLQPEHWKNNPNLEVIADANATPPLGLGGTDAADKGQQRHGKKVWGALGFGAFKLTLQRHCIQQLFTSNQHVFDAERIFELAKKMA